MYFRITFTLMIQTETRKSVQAQYLKKGDVLATGEVVTTSPWKDGALNSQKTYIGINGLRRTWNKRTEITILIN